MNDATKPMDGEIFAPGSEPGKEQAIERPTSAQVGLSADFTGVAIRFDPGKPSERVVMMTLDAAWQVGQQLQAAAMQAKQRQQPKPIILDALGMPLRRH
jgi:hypothetical protein